MDREDYKECLKEDLEWGGLPLGRKFFSTRSSIEALYTGMLQVEMDMDKREIGDRYRAMSQETSKSTKARALNELISEGIIERKGKRYKLANGR